MDILQVKQLQQNNKEINKDSNMIRIQQLMIEIPNISKNDFEEFEKKYLENKKNIEIQ